MLKLIDISNNNGKINWALLARWGPDAVVMKATQGLTFKDGYFPENWAQAKQYGIPRIAYDYGTPSQNSGHDEAEAFIADIASVGGLQSGDGLLFDSEDPDVPWDADLLAYHVDYFTTLKAAEGINALLYSRVTYMLPHNLTGHVELANNGLFLADWQTDHLPGVPAPWTFFAMWQYGSGPVPGVNGAVDLDVFNGTAAQLRLYMKP